MCVPLVCPVLVPARQATARPLQPEPSGLEAGAVIGRPHYKHTRLLMYNSTRVFAYIAAGALLGLASGALDNWSRTAGAVLALGMGAFLCLNALRMLAEILLPGTALLRALTPPATLQRPLLWLTGKVRTTHPALLGLVTVLLPCMTLTPALAMAAGSGGPLAGAGYMAAFALGTLPAMTLGPGLALTIHDRIPRRAGQAVGGLFLLLAGVITILRILH